MKRPDMSAVAVTIRLLRTEQLRRLCLALGRAARSPGRDGESRAATTAPSLNGRAERSARR